MTWWSGHKIVDPAELEQRFSTEDSMAFLEGLPSEEMSEESHAQLDKVREIMDQLPSLEADFLDLYYFRKIKQTSIAEIFGVSQPTVCYRLKRAADRIQFLLQLPVVDPSEMRKRIQPLFADPQDVEIMILMHETTCQSEVAKRLSVSQGFVRHRFLRSLEKLRKTGGFEEYVEMFELISANLNILREVLRPQRGPGMLYVVAP